MWWHYGWPRHKCRLSEYIGFLRKLSDAETWSILGCPFLHIMQHGKIWKRVFQIRPQSSYWLVLLEASSPGQGISTSSKKVVTEHLRLQDLCYCPPHIGYWKKTSFLPKLRACGPCAITCVAAVNQQCSPLRLHQGREADRLAATRDPQAGLQGHYLEIGMDLFNEVTELLTRN